MLVILLPCILLLGLNQFYLINQMYDNTLHILQLPSMTALKPAAALCVRATGTIAYSVQ